MDNGNAAIREATGVFCLSLLDAILPSVRTAARFKGYAIAVHGSLKRDIDLVAIAWTDQAKPVPDLVTAICGAVSGVLGNCFVLGGIKEMPHGRMACILCHPGFVGEIDLSIIPARPTKDKPNE